MAKNCSNDDGNLSNGQNQENPKSPSPISTRIPDIGIDSPIQQEEKKEPIHKSDVMPKIPVKTEGLVDASLAQLVQVEAMVHFAIDAMNARYTLFGSFVHYFVWCMSQKLVPSESHTIKKFMNSGVPLPNDLDIFDSRGTLLNEEFVKKGRYEVKTIAIVENKLYDDDYGEFKNDYSVIPLHSKHEFHRSGIIPVTFYVDRVLRRSIKTSLLDFNVNCPILNLRALQISRGPSLIGNTPLQNIMENGLNSYHTINGILTKTAQFIGRFEAGEEFGAKNVRMVNRFNKMISKGWKIIDWDEWHPSVIISDSTQIESCSFCFDSAQNGDRYYPFKCSNGFRQDAGLCQSCFWKWLCEVAQKGRYLVCPLCHEKRLIFDNAH